MCVPVSFSTMMRSAWTTVEPAGAKVVRFSISDPTLLNERFGFGIKGSLGFGHIAGRNVLR
jgi:hypothetical protein